MAQTQGRIDYLVAAASSGGTITGVAKYLAKNPNIKMILPDRLVLFLFAFICNYHKQSYQVEGAGKDRVCTIRLWYIDDVIQFRCRAFAAAKNKNKPY